jgi:hypothetical protein
MESCVQLLTASLASRQDADSLMIIAEGHVEVSPTRPLPLPFPTHPPARTMHAPSILPTHHSRPWTWTIDEWAGWVARRLVWIRTAKFVQVFMTWMSTLCDTNVSCTGAPAAAERVPRGREAGDHPPAHFPPRVRKAR